MARAWHTHLKIFLDSWHACCIFHLREHVHSLNSSSSLQSRSSFAIIRPLVCYSTFFLQKAHSFALHKMDDQKESVFRPCPSTSFYSNVPRKKIPKRASVRSTPYPTGSASSSPYRKGSQAKTDFTFSPQFKVSWKGRNGQMTVGMYTPVTIVFNVFDPIV